MSTRNWTVRSDVHVFDRSTGSLLGVIALQDSRLTADDRAVIAGQISKSIIEGADKGAKASAPDGLRDILLRCKPICNT